MHVVSTVAALSSQSRRQLVQQMAPRYQEASRARKILMLDALVAITGSVRTYAIHLLNHGISTTRAGTLLKNQIPIRTLQNWNETQPGLTSGRSRRPFR